MKLLFRVATMMLCLSVVPAQAAQLKPSNERGCSIELSGLIEDGDYEKLREIASSVGLIKREAGPFQDNGDSSLCLDSPGGSYIEGRMLSQLVHDNGIATRVSNGAECYSSCAFIFMSGRNFTIESDGPSRTLHVLGALGFHAPYFALDPDESFSGSELMESNRIITSLVSELVAFSSYQSIFQARPTISLSLFGEILGQSPEEVALVDTVEEVARWGIEIDGQSERAKLQPEQLKQACKNFQAWSMDMPSEGSADQLAATVISGKLYGKPASFLVVDTGGMATKNCEIELSTTAQSGFIICSTDEFSGVSFGNCSEGWGHWVPWYYALPPSTPVAELSSN